MKRETWRPQPTSSWAPARNDAFRSSHGESSTSSSAHYSPPPSGPSSSQFRRQPGSSAEEGFIGYSDRPLDRSDDINSSKRARWSAGEGDRNRTGRRSPVYDNRGARESEPSADKDTDRVGQPVRGYGRDFNPEVREDDLKKGTFRTKAQLERDRKMGGRPPTAPRDRGRGGPLPRDDRTGDRGWPARRDRSPAGGFSDRRAERNTPLRNSDNGYGRRQISPPRDSSPTGPSSLSLRGSRELRGDSRDVSRRRPSPDYGEPVKTRRSASRDSLYSPIPRRRSPSPLRRDRSPSPPDRKRGPPSPRGGDVKRQRDLSPTPSSTSRRRRRSTTRSRSRSRDRRTYPRSPSPVRNGRRASPYADDVDSRRRTWGDRSSPDRVSRRRERTPIPDSRDQSPSIRSSRSRSPIPPPRIRPSSPPARGVSPSRRQSLLNNQPDAFRTTVDPRQQAAPSRGPPFGGWGRSAGPLPDQALVASSASGRPHPGPHPGSRDMQSAPFGPRGSFPTSSTSPQRPVTGRLPFNQPESYPPPTETRPGFAMELNPYEFRPPTGPAADNPIARPPFPPHGVRNPPQQNTNGQYPRNSHPITPFGQSQGPSSVPVKGSYDNSNASPQQSGWTTSQELHPRSGTGKQFPDEPVSTAPFESASQPDRTRSGPVDDDRPPLQQPHVYLDLLDENQRKFSDHLRTVAPYIKAAFDQWFNQKLTPDLPDFLDHYFGRAPTMMEVSQIETLLGVQTRFARDQEELKVLHSQAIDLRERNSRVNANDNGHWSPAQSPVRRIWGRSSGEELSQPQAAVPTAQTSQAGKTVEQSSSVDETLVLPTRSGGPIIGAGSKDEPKQAGNKSRNTNASGDVYERVAHVGEGTYGKVYKARHGETGVFYALKRIRMEGEKDGFPVTAMREIKLLQNLRHPNVLRLVEMMVSKGSVYMVLEYMDHDLTGLLAQQNLKFSPANLKSLNYQMLSGLAYLHDQAILHRDMKGSNILLNAAGELKLADFGLARVYSKRQRDDYTNRVITLWYRGPELLLGETVYGPEVDMWSAGCIMLELYCGKPVFQGNDEIHQLEVIYAVMGTPDEEKWPGVKDLPWYELVKPKETIATRFRESFTKWLSPAALDLAQGLLEYDTRKRLSAEAAMKTPYFTEEEPEMEKPTQLANCGEHHEMSAKMARHRRRQQEGR